MSSDFKSIPYLNRISQNISWSRWYCEVESILLETSTSEFSRKELTRWEAGFWLRIFLFDVHL